MNKKGFMEFGYLEFLIVFVIIGGPTLLLTGAWVSARVESSLYNQKYNTTYTPKDFFFCGGNHQDLFKRWPTLNRHS